MLVLQEQVVAVFVGREESTVERIYRNIELVLQSELLVLELYVEIVAYIIILNHSSSVSMHASPSRRYISSYFQLVGAQGLDDPREQETNRLLFSWVSAYLFAAASKTKYWFKPL